MGIKKYISLAKLNLFYNKLIAKMTADDTNTLSSAKKYTDDELTDFSAEMNEAIDLLSTTVDGKANSVHTHAISQVDGLQAELNSKEAKGSANTALSEAKSYTDTEVASALSDAKHYTDTELAGLINGAPTTLDTLGEIATAMAENVDVVEALNDAIGSKASQSELNTLKTTVSGKADSVHTHTINDVTNLQTALDGKANSSHGTHVSYGASAPSANGTASAGSATTVSRSDHVHPLQTTVSGNAGTATKLETARTITLDGDVSGSVSFDGSENKTLTVTIADDSHNHIISNVDGLQTALDGKAASSHNQGADTITTGTFPTTAIYAKTGTDYTTARIRNIKASTTDLTAGTSTLSSGDIYIVYE